MNNSDIIRDALHNYDKNYLLLTMHLFKNITHYKFANANTIILYNNEQILYDGDVDVISIIAGDPMTWMWGWAHPFLSGKIITSSRKILNYALDLSGYDEKNPNIIKYSLTHSEIPLSSSYLHITILLALSSYLSQKKNILKLSIYDDDVKNDKDDTTLNIFGLHNGVTYTYKDFISSARPKITLYLALSDKYKPGNPPSHQ